MSATRLVESMPVRSTVRNSIAEPVLLEVQECGNSLLAYGVAVVACS